MDMKSTTHFIFLLGLAFAVPVGASASTCEEHSNKSACLEPLQESPNNPNSMTHWAIKFDYDTDGCLPSAAIDPKGQLNPGTNNTGALNGECAYEDQITYANTYYRGFCIDADEVVNKYCAHMYAQYFVKDQTTPGNLVGPAGGHRHDWEFGMSWDTLNDKEARVLTHATVSAHGKTTTKSVDDIYHEKDAQRGDHPYLVYHKDGASTHSMRFAKTKDCKSGDKSNPQPCKLNEKPENPTKQWVTATLVNWFTMVGNAGVTNTDLTRDLTQADFGSAIVPMKDETFIKNVMQSVPEGYPNPDEWQRQFNCGLGKC
ncbi:MAG: NPP1 family protein [Pseudomonadota bacterium]|nr:NPP1 family protein [Pseudomonadota bacterium]